jgi:anaerobic magnesium-protoporphyrin IX monomethyl ester cyclase
VHTILSIPLKYSVSSIMGFLKGRLALREAGCRKLIIGVESASNKILNLIHKKIDLAQIEVLLKNCSEIGISIDLEIIIGFPHESDQDFLDTYSFIIKN